MTCLSDLAEGQIAVLESVEGPKPFVERLCEVGFLPGVQVTIKNKLPFRGVLVVKVYSSYFALRHEDAGRIKVRPL